MTNGRENDADDEKFNIQEDKYSNLKVLQHINLISD